MPDLTFDISWEQGECRDPLEAATYGSLAIRVGAVTITEVQDHVARTTRGTVRVSAYPLALWLASAWWRLRWEGLRHGTDWRLSHQLGGAGSGYVWPELTLVSDGEWVRVDARRRSRKAWEPITYLNSAQATIPATDLEEAAAGGVEMVLARLAEMGHRDCPLSEVWTAVLSERRDASIATTRRLEAILGYDAEEAPAELLDAYADGGRAFGTAAVAELAALATNGELPNWGAVSEALQAGTPISIEEHARLRDQATRAVQQLPTPSHPWERGEAAAQAVREVLQQPRGPLNNETLEHWLGAAPAAASSQGSMAAFAERESPDASDLKLCYLSAHPDGRRFELARLLGDHLVSSSEEDRLLPATRARTARQSLQRAFAAELLLPWEDLRGRISVPDEVAMDDVAQEFAVSPLLVRTRLVAKGALPSDALDDA